MENKNKQLGEHITSYDAAILQIHVLDSFVREYCDKINEHKDNEFMLNFYLRRLTRAIENLNFCPACLDDETKKLEESMAMSPIRTDPETARRFLSKLSMYDENGKLKIDE